MKKKVLMLTICLALTGVSAIAGDPIGSQLLPNPFPSPQVQKVTQDSTKLDPPTKSREDLYYKLGLTTEQKAKAEAQDKINKEKAKPLMYKLRQERAKLRELKEKKAPLVEIYKQKQQVKLARKALKEHFEASRKSFEAILTECQLAKLKIIREERKAEFKKRCKRHFYHGHKPCEKKTDCPCPVKK